MFSVIESEGLIVPNTDNQMAGPRAYGYVSESSRTGQRGTNQAQ